MWEVAKSKIPSKPSSLYSCPWLNDCCDNLFKTGMCIEKVINETLTDLAPKVGSQMSRTKSETHRQCVYSLLGFRYVLDHFSETNYNPDILEKLTDGERQGMLEEAKVSIEEDIERLLEKKGHDRQLTYYSPETPLGSFLVDSQKVFKNGVDTHMRDNKLKIKKTARERSSGVKSFETGSMPEVWENQTDVLAQALVAVCDHEPERTWGLLKTFREEQYPLPAPVRIFLMKQFLLSKERIKFVGDSSTKDMEQTYHAQFLKVVHRNTSSLQVDRAIRSTLWKQIDGAVIETYGRVASLRPHDADEHQMEAARVLNVLHVYNKNFEPIFILWLFPVQLTFNYAVKSTASHVLELAMYLDLIIQHCIPNAVNTFAVASEIINIWRQWDKELLIHVMQSLSKDVWINQKDFPTQAICPERSEANKLMVKLKGRSKDDVPSECLKIFTDPAVFVRKWITEAFVGILNTNALLFVWDQLFFNDWSSRVIRDTCLAIIFLLKTRFTKAKNYFSVREIFICDPGRLYTIDFKRAYRHIENGNSFDDIPTMNRNAASAPVAKEPTRENVRRSTH